MLGLQTFRTRFGTDIVAQFQPADRATDKVAILLPGCPGYPLGKLKLSAFLARRGFLTIIPSYRGTWESDGSFLEFPPSEDVEIIINQLSKGFIDLWSEGTYVVHDPQVHLIGGSFGGAAAILASRHPSVVKAVSLSGVVDWTNQKHTVEPPEFMHEYIPKAFGNAYRPGKDALDKLERGDFYNPVHEKDTIDGSKLLFIHYKDDAVVHAAPAKAFATELGSRYVELSGNEHMGVSSALNPRVWKHIERFFKGK